MAQSTGAHLNFPELDLFLDHLYSRWSPEARTALCNLKPGANDSTARAIFDHELTTLCNVGRMVRYALRNIAASVGSQRNRYCKINDLPVEILREIFLSACEHGLRWKDLASILKTCKPWYNILSRDPAAYSTIDFGDYGCIPRLAKFFAKRNQSLPLDIIWTDIGEGTSVSKWKNKFCARHVSRVRALEFVHLHPPAGDWQLTTPAPQLERCKLVHCVDVENASEDGNDADFEPLEHIIPHLFGGDTPQLRTLDLHEVRLAWRPGNYSDLTYVKIILHSELLAQTHYDSDYITVIFRDSPRLERVELITSGSEDTWRLSDDGVPQLAPAQPKCVMRHLHTLHLHLSGPYIISILRAIEITPTIKTVDLHCGRNGFEDGIIQLQDSDGLRATRQFVVDLARLNVAILGPVKFGVGMGEDCDGYGDDDSSWDEIYNYTSVRALWPDGEVPELVQEVMGEVNV